MSVLRKPIFGKKGRFAERTGLSRFLPRGRGFPCLPLVICLLLTAGAGAVWALDGPDPAALEQIIERFSYEAETEEDRAFHERGRRLLAGEQVPVADRDEAFALAGYCAYRCYLGQPAACRILLMATADGRLSLACKTPQDRSREIRSVLEAFPAVREEDAKTSIQHTWQRVRERLCYDREYLYADLSRCAQEGRGVCWTYAQVMYLLLNAECVPTRLVCGYLGESCHAWNECLIEGTWVTVDATREFSPFVWDDSRYRRGCRITASSDG